MEVAKSPRTTVAALVGGMLALAVVGVGYFLLRDTKGPEPGPTLRGGGGQVRPAPVRPALGRPDPPATPMIPPERVPYGSLTLQLEPRDARVTLPDVEPRYRPGVRLPEGAGDCTKFGLPDSDTNHRPIGRHAGRIALEKVGPRTGETRVFDAIEFVWIPAGEFRMGSTSRHADLDEEPVTRVRLTRGFWMGKYEVTQAQWQAVMGSNPSRFKNCGGTARWRRFPGTMCRSSSGS